MAARRLRAQNLAARRDLESLGDGFSSFAARNGLRHRARKIAYPPIMTTRFCIARLGFEFTLYGITNGAP